MARKQTALMGQIRVIGGRWRGRKLPVLDAEGLRPTTDRLKETVFNWLQFELAETKVLDVFAGTGSLGIEALSRGAAQATFFEQDPAATQQLKSNLASLDATRLSHVQQGNALHLLAQNPAAQTYNVIFLDPPFHHHLLNNAIKQLVKHQWLANEALVYVETEHSAVVEVPDNWLLHREKAMGQSIARLFHVTSSFSKDLN